MIKGENAGNQHFLLLPQCFLLYYRQKTSIELHLCFSSASIFNFVGSRIGDLSLNLLVLVIFSTCPQPFTTQSGLFTTLKNKPFENSVGKGENAGNQHFYPFPTMFYTHPRKNFHF